MTTGKGHTGRSRQPTRRGPKNYHWLHVSYATVVLVLTGTGLVIQFPDLRARWFGGYGRELATVHEWTGVAMLVLPLAVLLWARGAAWKRIRLRSRRRARMRLHAVHLWFTLVSGVVFVVTGFVLWFQLRLPDAVVDTSIELHAGFSYVLYVVVPLHVALGVGRTWQVLSGQVSALRRRLSVRTPERVGKDCREDLAW